MINNTLWAAKTHTLLKTLLKSQLQQLLTQPEEVKHPSMIKTWHTKSDLRLNFWSVFVLVQDGLLL